MTVTFLVFIHKLGKMLQNLTSAAVMIGALRVKSKHDYVVCYNNS